ncbi:MAG TPA: FtsX-like permease family protein, partial [Vicinamibacterales bacterium]|nr:FtsX-like permease family protein [Vicinamibacterales bacterium]
AFEPIFALIVVDRNVTLFAAALSILSPLLFTLLPALHASDHTVGDALKEGGRSAGGVHARRSRHALVVAQVSLAFTLLVVSLLIVRSMLAVVHLDLGFDPSRLLVARLEVPSWKHGDDTGVHRTSEAIVDRIKRLPGVETAAATTVLPVLNAGPRVALDVAGRPADPAIDRPWALRVAVGDEYFRATGIPMLSGRAFQRGDGNRAESVAIVSAETSRRYWGSPDAALGSRIALARATAAEPEVWLRIVGIAGDIVSDPNPSEVAKPNPTVYLPLAQQAARDLGLVVRSSRPADVAAGVRSAIREIEPDAPVFQMRTLPEALDNEQASNWVITWLFAAFALLALVLASTGLYAVVAYSVSQRQHEIGVRMALGALPLDIRRLIVSQGARLIGIGGMIGLAGALTLSRAIRSLLFSVSPSDPATYAAALTVVVVASGLAMWLPTRHATRVDPIASLRSE